MISPNDPPSRSDASEELSVKRRRWRFSSWAGPLAAGFIAVVTSLMVGTVTESVRDAAPRPVDGSNLRQIGMASLIYANDHHDQLPHATDVWDYAEILAREQILNDANFWISRRDPANREWVGKLSTVLTRNDGAVDSKIRAIKPTWGVAAGEIHLGKSSSYTPIAWTRGLRMDGTWAPHAPYGSEGGYIVFLAGNIQFYQDLNSGGGQLLRHDGSGRTSSILEALPPGVRVSEYVPSEKEAKVWSRAHRVDAFYSTVGEFVAPIVWLATLLFCIVQAIRERWRWRVVGWFLFLTVMVLMIVLTY